MGRITKPALLYKQDLEPDDYDGNPNENLTPERIGQEVRDSSEDGDGQLYKALTLANNTWMPFGIGQ